MKFDEALANKSDKIQIKQLYNYANEQFLLKISIGEFINEQRQTMNDIKIKNIHQIDE